MRITIKHKSTGEQLVLSLDEFKIRFKMEFARAYQGYWQHETERTAYLPDFMQKSITETDFMLNFVWNFNNFALSEWYISRIS